MITINIRKQGGAAIITIPSNILKMLDIGIGSRLKLKVTQEGFIASPVNPKTRERYTLDELLCGVTSQNIKALNKATEWVREGEPKGRELL